MNVDSDCITLDTNILVYAFDEKAGSKHTIVIQIIQQVAMGDSA